tara:strand:+ start:3822 stop:4853 length:1032 start_codon:yes stop_codon:yes gene_type:complete
MNERDLKNLINQIKNNTQEALKSSQMGLWEEAERINRMMIQEIECDYRAYGRLADALMKLGKSAEAADYYDIVSDLDRSKKDITKKAIKLATESKWSEAVLANQEIIEDFPWDLEAYNRLGKAFMETGDKNKAANAFKCALVISENSVIAKKNLDRLNKINNVKNQRFPNGTSSNKSYIEETAKTSITKLVNTPRQLDPSNLISGDPVFLEFSSKGIKIKDQSGTDLGSLDPKMGSRLRRLIEGGNKYEASVTSISGKDISIIINEIFRSESQSNTPSFIKKSENMTMIPNASIGYTLNDDSKLSDMKDWTDDDTETGDETVFTAGMPAFISVQSEGYSEDDF